MIRVVIVDDEVDSLSLLENLLNDFSEVEVVRSFLDASEFLNCKTNLKYDVLFLDLEMPVSGLELAKLENGPVVFVSGKSKNYFDDIEKEQLNREQFAFLQKPPTQIKLVQVISKVLKWMLEIPSMTTLTFTTRRGKWNLGIENLQAICAPSVIHSFPNLIGLSQPPDEKMQEHPRNKFAFTSTLEPEVILEITFPTLIDILPKKQFIQISQSIIINRSSIQFYDRTSLEILIQTKNGPKLQRFEIGDKFQGDFINFIQARI
ncbi:MAG: response regulator [Flavobacteriales bacterium]|nr:response regulator [Flavobacteriales bacterium]